MFCDCKCPFFSIKWLTYYVSSKMTLNQQAVRVRPQHSREGQINKIHVSISLPAERGHSEGPGDGEAAGQHPENQRPSL